MVENKITEIKKNIKAQIENIKEHKLYPSCDLEGHISGLENALTIIEEIEPDVKIPLYESEPVKLSIVANGK